MQTVFLFKGMNKAEEDELREYVSGKLPKFEKVLSHFSDDGVVLQVKGEKFLKHSAYRIELVMKLPAETLTANEDSHTIKKAVDLAKDRLDLQLKKSVGLMRRGHRSVRAKNKMNLRALSIAQP